MFILIICNPCRIFNRIITIFVFNFASGCLNITGLFTSDFSVMKQISIGMELTTQNIPTCVPQTVLAVPLKAPYNIDSQWMCRVVWLGSFWLGHSFWNFYLHFLTLLMENVSLQTRLWTLFRHDILVNLWLTRLSVMGICGLVVLVQHPARRYLRT
jgi:hypothetical protein